jgi:hypothetical protein
MRWLLLAGALVALASCNDADRASANLSTDADNFRINRRIVFYDGRQGINLLVITGYCSLGNSDKSHEISVTCKTGPGQYKKDYLGLSSGVTYVVEQLDPQPENSWGYKVVFRPLQAIPDIEVRP